MDDVVAIATGQISTWRNLAKKTKSAYWRRRLSKRADELEEWLRKDLGVYPDALAQILLSDANNNEDDNR